MKIGTVELNTKIVLGPMAGVTDLAFRTVCRELSGCYTVSEMVSAKALCYGDKKTATLLKLWGGRAPRRRPDLRQRPRPAWKRARRWRLNCPARTSSTSTWAAPSQRWPSNGDGSALMRDPDKAARIAAAVVRGAAGKPVTVKFRLGWDKGSINCAEFAKRMEDAGVSAVAVHGRTRAQMYSGAANWDYIREVKNAVSIPVIANGDVFSPRDAVRILRYTGADMAMIGRGVFGNPWLLQQCAAAVEGRDIPELPPLAQRCDTAVRQFELARGAEGREDRLPGDAPAHYAWYLKGVPYASYWKEQICQIQTADDVYRVTAGIKRDLK